MIGEDGGLKSYLVATGGGKLGIRSCEIMKKKSDKTWNTPLIKKKEESKVIDIDDNIKFQKLYLLPDSLNLEIYNIIDQIFDSRNKELLFNHFKKLWKEKLNPEKDWENIITINRELLIGENINQVKNSYIAINIDDQFQFLKLSEADFIFEFDDCYYDPQTQYLLFSSISLRSCKVIQTGLFEKTPEIKEFLTEEMKAKIEYFKDIKFKYFLFVPISSFTIIKYKNLDVQFIQHWESGANGKILRIHL